MAATAPVPYVPPFPVRPANGAGVPRIPAPSTGRRSGGYDTRLEAYQSELFDQLSGVQQRAALTLEHMEEFDRDRLYQAGEQAATLENLARRIRCKAEYLLYQRASEAGAAEGGPQTARQAAAREVAEMARRFGVDTSTVYKDLQVYQTFAALPQWHDPVLAVTDTLALAHYQEALLAPDPLATVAVLHERADSGPVSRMQAREEVQRQKASAQAAAHPDPTVQAEVLYAAPAWDALAHPFDDLAALPVWEAAATDAVLLLRCPAPRLPVALLVLKRWDFQYRDALVLTRAVAPSGGANGAGAVVRYSHDLLLWGVRGLGVEPKVKLEGSVWEGAQVYDLVERLFPAMEPVALFADARAACPWPVVVV